MNKINKSPVTAGIGKIRLKAYGFIEVLQGVSIPADFSISSTPVIVTFAVGRFYGYCFIILIDRFLILP